MFPTLDPQVSAYLEDLLADHQEELWQSAEEFHKYAYDGFDWSSVSRWRGCLLQKAPTDLMVMQDLAYRLQPNIIIETGTSAGGSALFWADMCRLNGKGRVLSIDLAHCLGGHHYPDIEYLVGSSISPDIFRSCAAACRPGDTVLVDLDSDHHKDHVLAEMNLYAPLVSLGSYMIVEDTNINGHPVQPEYGPGPWEAVEDFLPQHPEFVRDNVCERYGVTFNPGGWLRRIKE